MRSLGLAGSRAEPQSDSLLLVLALAPQFLGGRIPNAMTTNTTMKLCSSL